MAEVGIGHEISISIQLDDFSPCRSWTIKLLHTCYFVEEAHKNWWYGIAIEFKLVQLAPTPSVGHSWECIATENFEHVGRHKLQCLVHSIWCVTNCVQLLFGPWAWHWYCAASPGVSGWTSHLIVSKVQRTFDVPSSYHMYGRVSLPSHPSSCSEAAFAMHLSKVHEERNECAGVIRLGNLDRLVLDGPVHHQQRVQKQKHLKNRQGRHLAEHWCCTMSLDFQHQPQIPSGIDKRHQNTPLLKERKQILGNPSGLLSLQKNSNNSHITSIIWSVQGSRGVTSLSASKMLVQAGFCDALHLRPSDWPAAQLLHTSGLDPLQRRLHD